MLNLPDGAMLLIIAAGVFFGPSGALAHQAVWWVVLAAAPMGLLVGACGGVLSNRISYRILHESEGWVQLVGSLLSPLVFLFVVGAGSTWMGWTLATLSF